MKYDFPSVVLHNSDGTVVNVSDTDTRPWTAQIALKAALLTDAQQNVESKMARYELFLKLRDHKPESEYTVEEIALLKKAAMLLPTIFAGQLSHLLDQK